ncbi:MAG: MBL fold metallo-hydrolase [Desulfocucumaceae bacterium]
MIDQIMPDLYRIEIPLPGSPLKAINSYVIKTPDRSLIIDTGMNRKVCMEAISSGLGEIGVDLAMADFFITHMHADHSGLVSTLASDTSKIYCSQPDSAMIVPDVTPDNDWFKNMLQFALDNGIPEGVLQEALANHPGFKYSSSGRMNFSVVRDGDTIQAGDYLFRCVETPGHTYGHMCLYDPRRKMLVSGDHILDDITPNISLWTDDRNPLGEYLSSLDKVQELDVDFVLPGHRRLIRDCGKRIRELKEHHRVRARQVLAIVEKGGGNAYQVASQMSWDLTYDSWDLFPAPQKWFATGEAVSHLKYLEVEGLVKKEKSGRKVSFFPRDN